uniref:ShKT domain-containing protein n=1 Tax=Trichuris muris TaxID=70415 RepID=A0A5S6QUW5_TRIMR
MEIRGCCFVTIILLMVQTVLGQCPCAHGRCSFNNTCLCEKGWVGKKCHRPCQDVYKACPYWKKEGRCVWTKRYTKFFLENCPVICNECEYDPNTVPPGLPLPPYLELLKPLIGEWHYDSPYPTHFPVNFLGGGYTKTVRIMLTEVPLFDTPSLNYTGVARSKLNPDDVQEEKGFLWVRPGVTPSRQVAFMLVTNTGVSMLQEGYLTGNTIHLRTVHDVNHPYSRSEQPFLREMHTLEWNRNWLNQSYKDAYGRQFKDIASSVTARNELKKVDQLR